MSATLRTDGLLNGMPVYKCVCVAGASDMKRPLRHIYCIVHKTGGGINDAVEDYFFLFIFASSSTL